MHVHCKVMQTPAFKQLFSCWNPCNQFSHGGGWCSFAWRRLKKAQQKSIEYMWVWTAFVCGTWMVPWHVSKLLPTSCTVDAPIIGLDWLQSRCSFSHIFLVYVSLKCSFSLETVQRISYMNVLLKEHLFWLWHVVIFWMWAYFSSYASFCIRM